MYTFKPKKQRRNFFEQITFKPIFKWFHIKP